MEITDAQILSAFRSDLTKEEAFKWLVIKYRERLYWQIRRMVINHEDADDVLQNVFIKVWKNLEKFQEQAQLFTWLYRIAHNETLNFLKQQKKSFSEHAEADQLQHLQADPFFQGDEIEKKLQAAIATLPDKQKAVFLLRYYDEMSYEKMSGIMGTSEGALKASYHHAVKKIEIFLKEH